MSSNKFDQSHIDLDQFVPVRLIKRGQLDKPSCCIAGYTAGATMALITKARVFMSGRSQHVTIPAEYRFTSDEVYVRRDPQSGDLILSQAPASWDEIYAALDSAGFADDFLSERAQGIPEVREEL